MDMQFNEMYEVWHMVSCHRTEEEAVKMIENTCGISNGFAKEPYIIKRTQVAELQNWPRKM